MEENSISNREWAKDAGVSESALRAYLRVKNPNKAMGADNIAKLARAVGVPLHVLVLYFGGHLPGDPLPPIPKRRKPLDGAEAQLELIENLASGLRKSRET
jgi:hypothetical protein